MWFFRAKEKPCKNPKADKNNLCHGFSHFLFFTHFHPGSMWWSGNTRSQHSLLPERSVGRYHLLAPQPHRRWEYLVNFLTQVLETFLLAKLLCAPSPGCVTGVSPWSVYASARQKWSHLLIPSSLEKSIHVSVSFVATQLPDSIPFPTTSLNLFLCV